MKQKIARITATVPADLHAQVRIQAFKEGIKINELIPELLMQWLTRKNKGEKRAA